MNYNVRIKLKTPSLLDIDRREDEINQIKDWLDAMVYWQDNQYSIRYLPRELDVWLMDEQVYIMCKLRWA